MKRFFTVFGLLALIGWSGVLKAQLFNDSIVINSNGRTFSGTFATDNYLFVNDDVNDSIYVISYTTNTIVASKKISAVANGYHCMKYSNGKLFITKDSYSIDMYDVTDIHNITFLQSLSGFNQGWMQSDKNDATYFYWIEHWSSKIRIIDFSTGTMVVKSNPSTGGSPQGASRIGNNLFVSNAYSMSKKFDISNPSSPTSTNFGTQATTVICTDSLLVFDNYFSSYTISLWSYSGVQLATKSPAVQELTTPDNFLFLSENSLHKLYDISNGSFNYIATSPRGMADYNNQYWIAYTTSKIILYPRVPCSDVSINDTTIFYVANTEFQLLSPKTIFEGTDSLTTQIGGCDSIVNHYSKFVYNPTYCTVTDTNYVTINDTTFISVTDTLIINAVLTGITPPNNLNTLKIYPNPASTHIYINNGDYTLMNGYTITIENSLSQVVFTSLINQAEFYVDLSIWTGNGLYIVKIIDNSSNVIETKKIIIQ